MKNKTEFIQLMKNMLKEWKWLFHYINIYKFQILLYILISIIATGTALGSTVASKYLIDAVVSKYDDTILKYAVLVVSLALFQIIFSAVSSWITALVSTKTTNDIREEIYNHILKSQWEEISSFHSGELLNRIEGDVSTVSSGVINFIPNMVSKLLQFFGSLIIVVVYDPTMAVLALLSAPFLVLSSRFLVRTIRKYNKKTREANGKVLSFSSESFSNIQVIKAFDLIKEYIDNFKNVLDSFRKVNLSYQKFSILMTMVLSVVGLVVSYACYGWGIYRYWSGVITIGTMTIFLQLSGTLTSSFSALASLAPSAITIATSAGRIMEITTYQTEKDSYSAETKIVRQKAETQQIGIFCKDVSFSYKTDERKVLDGIEFSAGSGETIAIIGPSGDGKTTILKLLLGLIEPDSGSLFIETEDGTSVPICDSTRRLCSYVPQEKSMFTGTIADNLRLAAPDAADDELECALKDAAMWDYVSSLPKGLETEIGEHGLNLSEGQAQRIAIARALLKKSCILILDEATSALDIETENKVLSAIMKKDKNRICVLTTHRDSMLKYCDRVYKINEEGKMVRVENVI